MITVRWYIVAAMIIILSAACTPPDIVLSPLPSPTAVEPVRSYGLVSMLFGQHSYLPIVRKVTPRIGIGMSDEYSDCSHLSQMGAQWHYNWSPKPIECPGSQAIPMVYEPGQADEEISESEYILIFNECDLAGCTTKEAAQALHTLKARFPNARFVGPNISHLGLRWLMEFLTTYVRLYNEEPPLWALGVHCYMTAQECEDWTTTNIALAKQWTKSGKVWVTEWASPPCLYTNIDLALQDADEFLTWMLANPDVEREAYFHIRWKERVCNTDLFDAAGLTVFGRWYRTAMVGK